MRKLLCIILSMLFVLGLSACSGPGSIESPDVEAGTVGTAVAETSEVVESTAVVTEPVDQTSDLLSEIETLNAQIAELQTENKLLKNENESLANQLQAKEAETTVQDNDVEVTFVGKVNIPKDIYNSQFSDRVEFNINAKNNTDKDIKGIQGTVDIQDMFGVSILKLKCDLAGQTIAPGETASYNDLGFDVNQFMNDHVKVYTTNYDDLIFVYTVNTIMFSDGTTNG